MAVSNVELIVSAAKAVNPLKRVQKEALTVEQRLKKTNEATRKVAQAFQFMGNRAKRALRDAEAGAAQLGKRMRTVGTAVKAASVAFAAYKAIQVGISRVESERRLKLLARGYGEVASIQSAAGAAASKFNLSQTEANQGIANAYARLRPLGVTLKDITSTFGGFRTAAVLGGATAAEASASFTQLSQALGSGALRGDEFRSVSEQAPLVLQAISDETGIATGKLKEYAAEGLITSDIVIKALKRIETEGADKLTEALGGPAAAIKNFQNATEDVAAAATETIIPQLATAFTDLAQIIRDLEGPIKFIGGLVGGLVKGIATVAKRVRRGGAVVAQAEMRAAAATRSQLPGVGANDPKFLDLYRKELDRRLAVIDGQIFGQLPPSAANLPGEDSETGTTPITLNQNNQKKLTRTSKARVDASQKLLDLVKKLTFSTDTLSEREKLVLELQIAQQRIREQNLLPNQEQIAFYELEQRHMESVLALEEKRARAKEKRAKEEREAAIEAVKNGFAAGKAADEQISKLTETEKLANSIGAQLGTGITDALVGAVKGTKDLGEAFQELASDILEAVGKALILKAVTAAIGSVGGGGGDDAGSGLLGLLFREKGGPVSANQPYVVGESGPELFVPGASGSITNNQQFEAARSSMSFYNGGGGGTPAYSPNIQATTMPDGMQYVTVEQMNSTVQAGMKVAANQGAAGGQSRTMNALRNSRSQRSKIGLGR